MKNNFFYKKQFSNIYKKTSRFSEVTSQILYGEKFKILSKKKNWIKIKTNFDNYIGYIKNSKYYENFEPTHKIYKIKSKVFKNNLNILRKFFSLWSIVLISFFFNHLFLSNCIKFLFS